MSESYKLSFLNKHQSILSDGKPYYCLICKQSITPEIVYDNEGEPVGYVYIHDDIEHPIEMTFNEDENPQ